jgi:hypothetical protein
MLKLNLFQVLKQQYKLNVGETLTIIVDQKHLIIRALSKLYEIDNLILSEDEAEQSIFDFVFYNIEGIYHEE